MNNRENNPGIECVCVLAKYWRSAGLVFRDDGFYNNNLQCLLGVWQYLFCGTLVRLDTRPLNRSRIGITPACVVCEIPAMCSNEHFNLDQRWIGPVYFWRSDMNANVGSLDMFICNAGVSRLFAFVVIFNNLL